MKTCLVVDDSNVVRKIAVRILDALSIEASEAESGEQALELCRETMPDAILLDGHMPPMPSAEFLSSLRAMTEGRKPVVIYCTTENDSSDIARVLAAGADDYIFKPFDRESIRAKLAATGLI
jgi:two-component system chemotaxis response regulator CheY